MNDTRKATTRFLLTGFVLVALIGTMFLMMPVRAKVLTQKERMMAIKVKFMRDFEAGFKAYRVEIDADILRNAELLRKAGAAPKTEAEAKKTSFPVQIEGTGISQDVPVTFDELEARKHAWIVDQLIAQRNADKRVARVQVIDAYLAGSPMAGLGECFVANAERTGICCYMGPVQAEAESSKGAICCGSFNPFGMIGCHFGSWDEAIARYSDNIVSHWGQAQNVTELLGYCVPDHPYVDNCQVVVDALRAQEAQICPVPAGFAQ